MENAAGFLGLNVLTDAADASVFLLLTRWTDEKSFRTWHGSEAHHQSHAFMPHGLKLDASFTSLTVGNEIENRSGAGTLAEAFGSHGAAVSRWLIESETIVVLLLARDGTILARNPAGESIFASRAATNSGSKIWEYLVQSDEERLRGCLSDRAPYMHSFLLSLADAQQNPTTLEAGVVRCGQESLLVGTYEQRHDSKFQHEILKLTNDLSVMMRESVQKNRELKQANETIERLARTDGLTGLANRRTLDEVIRREIARAPRQEQPLSIIMGDLDRFKSINDQYGHQAGDQVLASAAAVFSQNSRPYDFAARYGGEEFILLLPGATMEDAMRIAERLRSEVEKVKVTACPREITISLGVATWILGEGPEALLARADGALYGAKNNGRNRVEAAHQAATANESQG